MNNKDGSILKPEDWIGYAYLALMLALVINMGTILVFKIDWMAAIGIVVVTEHKMLVFAFFAFLCFVNLKHDDSDRLWNFAAFAALLVVLTTGNIGVKIDASQAGQKIAAAASDAQQRASTSIQDYKPPVPQQRSAQPASAPAPQNNAFYNIYRKNNQSGSNYAYCVNLLKGGDIAGYTHQKCNTGGPLPKNNITTCQKFHKQGRLNTFEEQGCGFNKLPQYKAWCNLNVGQKGQNRDLFCR